MTEFVSASLSAAILAVAAVGSAVPAAAQSGADRPPAAASGSGEAAGTKALEGVDVLRRARLDLLIPTGGSHHGVRYPIFLEVQPDPNVTDPLTGLVLPVDQPLGGLFECDTITRMDADHLRLDGARWIQFDQKSGLASVIVTMERGIFDLQSEILMSSSPVRVERESMTIEGDSFLHDRRTGMTRFTGNVRMTAFQPSAEPAASDNQPTAAEPPAPVPTPPAPTSEP